MLRLHLSASLPFHSDDLRSCKCQTEFQRRHCWRRSGRLFAHYTITLGLRFDSRISKAVVQFLAISPRSPICNYCFSTTKLQTPFRINHGRYSNDSWLGQASASDGHVRHTTGGNLVGSSTERCKHADPVRHPWQGPPLSAKFTDVLLKTDVTHGRETRLLPRTVKLELRSNNQMATPTTRS
jgi:hypothetical protein